MSSRYLEIAYKVISVRGRPLTAQEILRDADRYGLLPENLTGETMQKTLQARITEDLSDKRERSAFYRTGPGIYFLRELSDDTTLAHSETKEFKAPGRSRPPAEGRILCYTPQTIKTGVEVYSPTNLISFLESCGRYHKFDQIPDDAYTVGTFSVISKEGEFFQYLVGKHSQFSDAIGERSIGLRRYIDEFDRDLFSADDFGIDMSAAREVLRNISRTGIKSLEDDRAIRMQLSPDHCLIDHDTKNTWFVLNVETHNTEPLLIHPIRRLDITKPNWTKRSDLNDSKLDKISKFFLSLGPKN